MKMAEVCGTFALVMVFFPALAQSVIIDGKLVSSGDAPLQFRDYRAELRTDDSILIEKQRINSAGVFTFQLRFAHDYYLLVRNKADVLWQLLVRNRMETGLQHYRVTIDVTPPPRPKDVYEITFDREGNKHYLKNGQPITEITYRFETERRDSTTFIKK